MSSSVLNSSLSIALLLFVMIFWSLSRSSVFRSFLNSGRVATLSSNIVGVEGNACVLHCLAKAVEFLFVKSEAAARRNRLNLIHNLFLVRE